MDEYQRENTELFEFFLENSFYKSWRSEVGEPDYFPNYDHLELMVNHKCDLKCKYCYMDKYYKDYFPQGTQSSSKILHNTDILMEWLLANGFTPEIEIFAGDSIGSPVCRQIIHKFQDAALDGRRASRMIVAPTNFSWGTKKKQREDLELLLEKSEYSGIPIYLSFSVDGKYMEANRPFKSKKSRYTDEYYDRMFKYMTTYPLSGCHPMVYSEGIEHAIENFLWWQGEFEKYGIDWRQIYYLEVRNEEWTVEQTKHYAEFIKFLVRWAYEKAGSTEDFIHFLYKKRGFNILLSPLVSTGRGMPCSIQSCLCLRMGDLTVVPCHRTAYKFMETATARIEDGKLTGFDAKNTELWYAIQALDNKRYPVCERCTINNVCSGGCLGSQYESTGQLFSPIPTVCRLFHAKIAAIVEVATELGIFSDILRNVSSYKYKDLIRIKNALEGV